MAVAERSGTASARVTVSRTSSVRIASIIGLGVLAVVLIPQARAWGERESLISAARARLDSLSLATAQQPGLEATVQLRETELSALPQRILRSRSRALAASALQSLVQEMAESSNVTVTRLDVAGDVASEIANSASGRPSAGDVPITLTANGDIYGLTELLRQIQTGRFVIVVDKLQTQNNSALRGAPDVLQIALSLHAPVIVE
ncbi:MAG: GspMb/PilO family protein [Gemmatimonas sp.]